jgi:hypothetical protein
MINSILDLLDLEMTLTKRKRIAKMALRAQDHRKESMNDETGEFTVNYYNAAKKVAPPKTSKEYIEFVASINETAPDNVRVWADELLR